MADNTINWGQGAINNEIGWGKGKANATNDWGKIYDTTATGDTDILGASASTFTNTKSVHFDGVNDYVTAAVDISTGGSAESDFVVNSEVNLSISFWFKYQDFRTGVAIFQWAQSLLDGGPFMLIRRTANNKIQAFMNGSYFANSESLVLGTWHHVFFIKEHNVGAKFYVNNVLRGTGTGTGTNNIGRAKKFEFGQGYNGYSETTIDEVSLYNKVLTSEERTAIYNSGTPTDLSSYNPYGWWRMGDDSGDVFPTIKDIGSGGYDFTMTNMASDDIIGNVPSTTVGVANTKSLDFDGVNDYVNAGDKDEYSFGDGTNDSPFSMSFWFYADNLSSTNRVSISKFGTSTQREYAFRVDSSFVIMSLCDTSNQSNRIEINHTVGVTFNTGQWYHIAFTYDGSGTTAGADIYVNGVVASTATKTKSLGYVAMGNKNVNLEVGARTGGGKYTDGHIDEFALFDYELSADAISEIYNIRGSGRAADMNNLTNATTDPILWYRMGDGDTFPTITNHGSLSSADGTMTNMASDDITDFTF